MFESPSSLSPRDAQLLGALVECPHSHDIPANCPLHDHRHRTMRERYAWFHALDTEQLDALSRACGTCAHAPQSPHVRAIVEELVRRHGGK